MCVWTTTMYVSGIKRKSLSKRLDDGAMDIEMDVVHDQHLLVHEFFDRVTMLRL